MQSPHHFLKFNDLIAKIGAAAITEIGCEKANAIITPVIRKSPVNKVSVDDILMHRHKFNRIDTKQFEIFYRFTVRYSSKFAFVDFRNFWQYLRKSLDVKFI